MQLIVIREHCGTGDDMVSQLFDSFDDEALQLHSGVYTEPDLRARFERVAKLCQRTALLEVFPLSLLAFLAVFERFSPFRMRTSPRTRLSTRTRSRRSSRCSSSRARGAIFEFVYFLCECLDLERPPNTQQLLERARYHITERRDLATAIR